MATSMEALDPYEFHDAHCSWSCATAKHSEPTMQLPVLATKDRRARRLAIEYQSVIGGCFAVAHATVTPLPDEEWRRRHR
jgi:hypothetical protein